MKPQARLAAAMRTLDAYKVDAFTTTPYTGNIAGVVPEAEGLTDRQMQAIAREMNVSETSFVMPPTAPGAAFKLRYFTPTSEIPLCGHATVAAFHVLVERGVLPAPAKLKAETNVGVLDIDVRADGSVFLSSEPMRVEESPYDRARCAEFLGLPVEEIVGPVHAINRLLLVPVSGLKALETMRPDLDAMRAEGEKLDGVAAVSLEPREPGATTQIRYFVPALGIPEDPVTGVAHMRLAAYLVYTGRITTPTRFLGGQGHECGRAGLVQVEVDGPKDALRVKVGGRAVTTLTGRLRAP